MVREYKDKFTLDGRLRPPAGVNRTKLKAAKNLLERAFGGDLQADAKIRESIATTDAVFNFAYLTNLEALQQYDVAPRVWSQIAGVRTVPDFRNVTLYSLFNNGFDGHVADGLYGTAPVVPEGAPYPYASVGTVEALQGKIKKRGFKTGFTFEARINDAIGFFEQLPGEMVQVGLNTEEAEIFDALTQGKTSAATLQGGQLPDGTTVPVNAPLAPNSIWEAIIELSRRRINGRYLVVNGGYNVIVPQGTKAFIDWHLRNTLVEVQDGALTFAAGAQTALSDVNVIETPRLSGSEWYLLPKPGTTRRPVLELGRLRGYEGIELRVNNATGSYIGGGAVAPFEGSFDNDVVDFRERIILGGILWSDDFVVYSNGTGAA